MSFPFLEAWRCIRALMDRGHLSAAVEAGLPAVVAIRLYEGALIERICEAEAIRTADRNVETDSTRRKLVEANLGHLRMEMLDPLPNTEVLSLVQEFEQSQTASTVLAVLCTMFLQEGLLVDQVKHRRKNASKDNPTSTTQRPDAWRRRLVDQFPELAKEVELLLVAVSDRPVRRSARRIVRDQRDTRRPDRRSVRS